jgi:hypothetical protein
MKQKTLCVAPTSPLRTHLLDDSLPANEFARGARLRHLSGRIVQ